MYQTHINELISVNNASSGTSLLGKLANRYSNSSSSDEYDEFKYAEGRRSRRRKSRHHKKTNRRQKSNIRKTQHKKK
jgi:hypothetical protein